MKRQINRSIQQKVLLVVSLAISVCMLIVATRISTRAQVTSAQASEGAPAQPTSGNPSPAAALQAPLPSFEVASIKPHVPDNLPGMRVMMGGPDVSRFTASNVTAKMLIGTAYGVKEFQISGGPSWINSDRFDIDAKVEDSLAEQLRKLTRAEQQAQTALMIRSLLLDRFKLQITRSTKEGSVLALVVAKGGPKLTEVPPPDQQAQGPAPLPSSSGRGPAPGVPPAGGAAMMMSDGLATLRVNAAPITNLANMLSLQVGRQVVDQTGLKGFYQFTLQFAPQSGMAGLSPGGGDAGADSNAASIFTALEEQLGLKLEDAKAPVDTITIDRIEEPSEN
jgi:uncharacterized protein (TIGR03435 family)